MPKIKSTLLDLENARNSVTKYIQSIQHVLNLIQGNIYDACNIMKKEQICSVLEQNDTTKVAIQKLKGQIIENYSKLDRLQSNNITYGHMVNKLNSTISELKYVLLLCKHVKHHAYDKLFTELELNDLLHCIPKNYVHLYMNPKHKIINRLEECLQDQKNTLTLIREAYEMEVAAPSAPPLDTASHTYTFEYTSPPAPSAPPLDTASHTYTFEYTSPPAYNESASSTHTRMTGESYDIPLFSTSGIIGKYN